MKPRVISTEIHPLPKGVTGFDSPYDGVSVTHFTKACQDAARQAYGSLGQVRAAYEQMTPNFHEALVTLNDGKDVIRVICNAHFPIVAFTLPATYEGDVRLRFLDCPEFAKVMSNEFIILSAQEACAGISSAAVAQLGEDELDQMRYWRPQRMGDVIFNYWD